MDFLYILIITPIKLLDGIIATLGNTLFGWNQFSVLPISDNILWMSMIGIVLWALIAFFVYRSIVKPLARRIESRIHQRT